MLFRLWLGVLVALAWVLAPKTGEATTIRIYDRAELEDLASGSTHVVVGRFVGWKHEAAIASAPFSVTKLYGDVDLARIRVEEVIAGERTIEGREVLVSGRFAGEAGNGAVLFLRRERDRFWVVNNSLFRTSGNEVNIATAPGRTSLPLSELRVIVEPVQQARVTWTARIADRARAGGTLSVVFSARNESSMSVAVLPPSQCTSVKSYPLGADGLWHANDNAWHTAPSEWFRTRGEKPVVVGAGADHEFAYDIPLASMNMDWAGQFDVVLGMTESFCNVRRGQPWRALPNYMPDRVLRVTVEGTYAPPSPPRMTSAPPAYAVARQSGCAATTTSTTGAVTRAFAFGVAVVVGIVIWRRRARKTLI